MSITQGYTPGGSNTIPRKQDFNTVIPRFFTQEMEIPDTVDPETGLKKFRSVEFVELLIPGDSGNKPVKRVTDYIRNEYSAAYQAFKTHGAGADMVGDGIPLKLWPGIKSEIARGLEQINVYTVQQLASLADGKCSLPGTLGLRDLRDKARAFLESVGQTAPLAALQAQIDDMKKKGELRDAQLQQALDRANELQAQVNAMGGGAGAEQPRLTTPRERPKEK
jgi:hypothetical protein